MRLLDTRLPEIRITLLRDPTLDEYARERLFDLLVCAYQEVVGERVEWLDLGMENGKIKTSRSSVTSTASALTKQPVMEVEHG